ncbi:MAG: peptidase U32 [Deltaproteobacteria bacterium CG_4_10_14_3_um_filter_60_8]|nr:MAG: peptidase U32 [Deltaproteobacteria bacterium CG_4_10_14_3_um_filter_60_8]
MSMQQARLKKMELLAPAGTVQAFEAAVDAGADAVYVGAPFLNARALARNFSYEDLAAMVAFSHQQGAKVYTAMNSLMKEEEIPQAVETMAVLDGIGMDGLILQDMGVYGLARRFFPRLRLHASTLMVAHNSMAVAQFVAMGFARVVLARELDLREIAAIRSANPQVELEVFVHGALCFSYSGLCMFSSYLGGKSGLRGRCVQPCRRRYAYSGKGKPGASGYLFSMNDLEGLDFLPALAAAGVHSIKIEGRMRSVHYVREVVRSYRLVLDHPGDATALAEAHGMLGGAMGRKASPGYFPGPDAEAIISPYHSGNIGLFLGKIKEADKEGRARLVLKEGVRVGDRLRLHMEGSGERLAFTLHGLLVGGQPAAEAAAGARVAMDLPQAFEVGDTLFKVDVLERRGGKVEKDRIDPASQRQKIAALTNKTALARLLKPFMAKAAPASNKAGKSRSGLPLWLRVDDLRFLQLPLPFTPAVLVVELNQQTLGQRKRLPKALALYRKNLVWALPAIIEEKRLGFYQQAIDLLWGQGQRRWQIGHLGQMRFFHDRPGLWLAGDYSLSILNSQALAVYKDLGVAHAQMSMETDRENLRTTVAQRLGMALGLTVYGLPPLFTARLAADWFHYGAPFVSPKGESFVLKRKGDVTLALPKEPFSLLGHGSALAAMGLAYGVVDLSLFRPDRRELESLGRLLTGKGRLGDRLGAFNYLGGLL